MERGQSEGGERGEGGGEWGGGEWGEEQKYWSSESEEKKKPLQETDMATITRKTTAKILVVMIMIQIKVMTEIIIATTITG